MNKAGTIIGALLLIIVLGLSVILIRLAFDSDFRGERAEHLLFEGTVLFVITLVGLKYWLNDETD